jgi:acyl-CoA thioester hydrolase
MTKHGSPATRHVDTEIRVRYAETDQMGIAYHGNYVIWFEVGRTEYCRAAGAPYRSLEDRGVRILVTGVDCTYRRSARYDDRITIRTRIAESGSRGVTFHYQAIRTEDGALLAEGTTRHVYADHSGRPVRAPDWFRKLFERFVDPTA